MSIASTLPDASTSKLASTSKRASLTPSLGTQCYRPTKVIFISTEIVNSHGGIESIVHSNTSYADEQKIFYFVVVF